MAIWRLIREHREPVATDEPIQPILTEDEQEQPVRDAQQQVEQDELLGLLVMR